MESFGSDMYQKTPVVIKYFTILKELAAVPLHIITPFINYLKESLPSLSQDPTENDRMKCKLTKLFDYVCETFEKSPGLSWYDILLKMHLAGRIERRIGENTTRVTLLKKSSFYLS